jgi:hypothetical protein
MVSFVRGFRPILAERRLTENAPNPTRETLPLPLQNRRDIAEDRFSGGGRIKFSQTRTGCYCVDLNRPLGNCLKTSTEHMKQMVYTKG